MVKFQFSYLQAANRKILEFNETRKEQCWAPLVFF